MSKTAWPTVAEVTDLVTGLGFSVGLGTDVQAEIDGAVEELEEGGYKPFMYTSGADDVAYYYDPPRDGRILYLRGGMTGLNLVRVGYVASDSGASATTLTENEDYFLEPQRTWSETDINGNPHGLNVTRIRFLVPQFGFPRSVEVTGNYGYDITIPNAAWLWVRNRAVCRVVVQAQGGSGSPMKVKQGGFEVQYESPDMESIANSVKSIPSKFILPRVG